MRLTIVLWLVGILIPAALLAHFVYRPWQMTWGAADHEIARAMPGDDLVTNPTFVATRAVTIYATPEDVWPWLVQMGYHRAGFYSHDFLDNRGIPSAEKILPHYQHLAIGDTVPLSADDDAEVAVLERDRSLVLVFHSDTSASWAWGLYPAGPRQTRLISRLRVNTQRARVKLLLEYFEIIMMRKCMLGIRRRAESSATEQ